MSIARKNHNHKQQTIPGKSEEEAKSDNKNTTFRTPQTAQLSLSLSLPQCDDCKTRKDTKCCTTKQGPNTKNTNNVSNNNNE